MLTGGIKEEWWFRMGGADKGEKREKEKTGGE